GGGKGVRVPGGGGVSGGGGVRLWGGWSLSGASARSSWAASNRPRHRKTGHRYTAGAAGRFVEPGRVAARTRAPRRGRGPRPGSRRSGEAGLDLGQSLSSLLGSL